MTTKIIAAGVLIVAASATRASDVSYDEAEAARAAQRRTAAHGPPRTLNDPQQSTYDDLTMRPRVEEGTGSGRSVEYDERRMEPGEVKEPAPAAPAKQPEGSEATPAGR